ncbi:MAG TPA: HD domain-containing protein [Candidatus Polarisedimenticolia bacterium]|nr:HD domain-containing protein [Candidatus Polarisedimenticolia bacterium]
MKKDSLVIPKGRLAGLPEAVKGIAAAASAAGGRAFLVGGFVRDLVRRITEEREGLPEEREFDLEIYGLPPDRLAALLRKYGSVNLVGESFAVYKVSPRGAGGMPGDIAIDVSLPRRDQRTGRGHRGFAVEGDPQLSIEEASRRRDFTVNALLLDPLTGEVLDPWGGLEDLGRGVLRAVDEETFAEDSLRVLRGMQFAARLGFGIDDATVALCRSLPLDDLPGERVWGEMEKLLMKAERPSIGLDWGLKLGAIEKLFPELQACVGCLQEKEWHPEGDVWVHTLLALDIAKREARDLPYTKQATVMLAVLCHDLGKPATTAFVDGRIRSYEHEEAGLAPTEALLDRLKVHTLDGYDVRSQVLALVGSHLSPSHLFKNRDKVGDGAFRRLARRLEPELLYRVSRADCLGRSPGVFATDAQEWFIEKVRALGVEEKPPRPILMGRHLLELGLRPGPEIGRITRAIYEMQLDGRVSDLDGALAAAREMLSP